MQLYPDLADLISVIILALNIWVIYLALKLARITRGAPRAWYVIILGFVLLFGRRMFETVVDLLNPATLLSVTSTLFYLAVIVCFLIGVYMLKRTFERSMGEQSGPAPATTKE